MKLLSEFHCCLCHEIAMAYGILPTDYPARSHLLLSLVGCFLVQGLHHLKAYAAIRHYIFSSSGQASSLPDSKCVRGGWDSDHTNSYLVTTVADNPLNLLFIFPDEPCI